MTTMMSMDVHQTITTTQQHQQIINDSEGIENMMTNTDTIITSNGNTTMKARPSFIMDYEKYRDDQLNTGVIAALLGGFALTNSWEIDVREGTRLDCIMYALAIIAAHVCTCSAVTSAILYRTLTHNDPKQAVLWMRKHPLLARLAYQKLVIGISLYIVSVMLIAWKELSNDMVPRIITLVIGVLSATFAAATFFFVHYTDPPAKC
mmetsp:Transcript_22415/g.25751  ORF Transcript_22415/g.25751 Transcript_22415/m.25751 type:complete len:206 (-) Transcript_22415:96-713(-)